MCIHAYTHIHTHTHTYIYIYIHTYIYTYTYIYTHIHTHIYIHTQTHMHIYTYTHITANPKHTPHTSPAPPSPTTNMQLLVGYLQLKLILKNYQNAKSNSNTQRNDIMENSFTHCTIDVMPVVILICNEKLLSSCSIKTNMYKRDFSQT